MPDLPELLNQSPLSLGDILIANAIVMLPVYLLIGRGVVYLGRMTHKVEIMWRWFQTTQIRSGDSPLPALKRRSGS